MSESIHVDPTNLLYEADLSIFFLVSFSLFGCWENGKQISN